MVRQEKYEKSKHWYLDSGASHHMSPNDDWFENYRSLAQAEYVTIGDGSKITVLGKGTIRIKSWTIKEGWYNYEIKNVLHVPELAGNLLSLFLWITNLFYFVLIKRRVVSYSTLVVYMQGDFTFIDA